MTRVAAISGLAAAESGEAVSAAAEPMDAAAFQSFYRRTAPALQTYIRRVCGDAGGAEDLLQEAYLRLLRTPLPPLSEPQLKAYLFRAATRLIYDEWKRRRVDGLRSLQFLFRKPAPENPNLKTDMERFFGELKPRERALLWLAYVEGYDHREMAEILNLGEKSVRVSLFRARNRLAGVLRRHGFTAEVKA
ncbi:MAG: RNA polymerase sigma factor [Candidatus Solibacter usitatus]|nr:RNA polymerase sigma factor [Candidatus Solibacter usitatus]